MAKKSRKKSGAVRALLPTVNVAAIDNTKCAICGVAVPQSDWTETNHKMMVCCGDR
jgi:hypothetical protein